MKLPLVATRIGIMLVKVLVAVIVVLSVLPFIMGDISVDFDTDQETDWTYEQGTIRLSAPFIVENRGFFDINDMHLDFTLRDGDGGLLAQSVSEPMSAPAGRETNLHLDIELDLTDLPVEFLSDLIFNGTEMRFTVAFSAKYTMDLVQAGAEIESEMEWEAMIRDMELDTMNARPTYADGYYMQIPYSFHASGMVEGEPMLVTVGFADGHGYQETVQAVVYASGHYYDWAYVPIPQATYDRLMTQGELLSASLTLGFLDCNNTVQDSWWWSP